MLDPRIPTTSRQRESSRARATYEAYAAMGRGRSLAKLHRHLTDTTPETDACPSLDGLKYWSRTYRWADRVAAHDAKVAARVQEQAIQHQVQERVDALGTVDHLIVECAKILAQHAGREKPLRLDTPPDFRAITTALTDAARLKELLEGRATERFENMTEEQIDRELAELRRQEDAMRRDPDEATRH